MAEELQLQVRKATKDLPSLFREVAEILRHPIIIATKGHPCTGRRLVAFSLAAALRCPLIKEEANQGSYQAIFQNAASQIEFGLSVVIDFELCSQSQFDQLKNLAKCTETQLIIFECQPRDESELWRSLEQVEDVAFATRWWGDKPSSLEDLRRRLDEFKTHSDYDVADIPKFIVEITPAGDIKKCVSSALQSIATYQAQTPNYCECHNFEFWDEQKNNQAKCPNCQQQISGPVYRCSYCNFIFHKSCTELPLAMKLPSHGEALPLKLIKIERLKGDVGSDCCNELLRGYVYEFYRHFHKRWLDLNCIFLPSKHRVKFHEHQLELSFDLNRFDCDACGVRTANGICYSCPQCRFRIDRNCAWLPETAVYERHRHPFKLSLSPRDDADQYYCNACEKERDPKHWIYCCAECDFPAHTRCLVPSALPPSESDNN